jgi:lactate permease
VSSIWEQKYLLWGQGLAVSSLAAAVPILVLLVLLAVKRKPAWQAGLWGLAATGVLAVGGYGMSVRHTLSSAAYGAAFGLFPITWIVYWALVLYGISVKTGKFEIIKQSVGAITADMRLQVLFIAFAFGAFLEGGAGFGTPVAVAAAMMIGLGFSPLYASAICLLANTVPVAFGAIGIPVITLAGITGLPLSRLSADVGRLCAPISFIVPAYLIAAISGRAAVLEVWPAVLVCGGTFAGMQFLISNFVGAPLTDIAASLTAMGAMIVLLRFWRPKRICLSHESAGAAFLAGSNSRNRAVRQTDSPQAPAAVLVERQIQRRYTAAEILVAWSPYLLLVLFVLAWGYKPVQQALNTTTIPIRWPWLHNEVLRRPPVIPKPAAYAAVYSLNWLSAAGTSCMFAALFSAVFLRMKWGALLSVLLSVARQLFLPTITITSVLAMAFVMNYCGATGTLGLAFAATGAVFPFFSSFLGWLGVFLTGSDTSSNALFGSLQVVTANRLGFGKVLIAAANSAGGVTGKMISLQSIAVAAAATGLTVSEQAKLFRFTLRHSLLLAGIVGLEVMIYAYAFRMP